MNKINVTEARKDMSTFFDGVIHEKPIILKRRKNEAVLVEKSLLQVFLNPAQIKVKVTSSSKSEKVNLYAIDLNVSGEGETRADAEMNLCEKLIEYANEIYNNFMFYFYGQNIRDKLCYVFNILLCEDAADVKAILSYQTDKKIKKK